MHSGPFGFQDCMSHKRVKSVNQPDTHTKQNLGAKTSQSIKQGKLDEENKEQKP
jgi:hypothetical protein